MPAPLPPTALPRLADFVVRRHRLILLVTALLTAVCGWRASKLQLRTNLADLLPQNDPAVATMRETTRRLPSLSTIVVAVPGPDPQANRRFVDALVPRLEALRDPDVAAVDWNVRTEIGFFERHALLYASVAQLEDARATTSPAGTSSGASRRSTTPCRATPRPSGASSRSSPTSAGSSTATSACSTPPSAATRSRSARPTTSARSPPPTRPRRPGGSSPSATAPSPGRSSTSPARRRQDPDGYQRLPGAAALPPRGLAILRELHAWREARADAIARPAFRVLQSATLIALATTAPRTTADLAPVPEAERVARHADALLGAVARGLAVPEPELPERPRPPQVPAHLRARIAALKAVRDRAAAALRLEPSFLLPQRLITSLAEAEPRSLEELGAVAGLRRWRIEALGPALVAALAR
jgi:hypothetical protein